MLDSSSADRRNILKPSFALALLTAAVVFAGDPVPLDIKTGEWEYTVTMQMSGMPQPSAVEMPQIPADQLARIPPEQRAKIEAALKQAGNIASGKPMTSTNKNCVRKDDLARMNPMGKTDKSCKMTVVNSSANRFEAKMVCDSPDNKTTSTITVEASSTETSKFKVISTGTAGGHPMNMTVNGTGKWLSAACTDAK